MAISGQCVFAGLGEFTSLAVLTIELPDVTLFGSALQNISNPGVKE
jgi:hypothetical protein